jgi:hypothetical protein
MAKRAQKMANTVALGVLAASVTTPTDDERRKKDLKRVRGRTRSDAAHSPGA